MRRQTVFPLLQSPVGRMARSRMATSLAPRMAPAALRIPNPVHAQLSLAFPASPPQIFVNEGARQTCERRLRSSYPGPVLFAVTDNRHSMISHARRGGTLRARI